MTGGLWPPFDIVELPGRRIQHGEERRREHVGVGMVAHDEIVGQVHGVLQRDRPRLWRETLARAAAALAGVKPSSMTAVQRME